MPKNAMIKILEDPLRHENLAHGYNGVLAGLYARILHELKIGPMRWYQLMGDFINDARNGKFDNQKDRTSMRGNLLKEFSREQMTWKVFIKGLRFLQIQRFQLTITAWHVNGSVTTHHSKMIKLGDRRMSEFLEDVDSPDEDKHSEAGDSGSEQSMETYTRRQLAEHRQAAQEAGQQDLFEAPVAAGRTGKEKLNPYDALVPDDSKDTP